MSERPSPEALAKDIQLNGTALIVNTHDSKARSALLRDSGFLTDNEPSDRKYVEQVQQALKTANVRTIDDRGSGLGISVYPGAHLEVIENLPGTHFTGYEKDDEVSMQLPNYRAVVADFGRIQIIENDENSD